MRMSPEWLCLPLTQNLGWGLTSGRPSLGSRACVLLGLGGPHIKLVPHRDSPFCLSQGLILKCL